MTTKKSKVSRRKFLKTGSVAAAGAATLAMPNVSMANFQLQATS